MKMYKRYYHITVTDSDGKLVYETEEYSGYSTDEEMRYLRRTYPNHRVYAEFKEEEL